MGYKLILFTAFTLIISYAIYNLYDYLEVSKTPQSLNDDECIKIEGPAGMEDIVKYKQQLIFSALDRVPMILHKGDRKNDKGGIYITNSNINPETRFEKLELIDFPKNVTLRPHGISIFKNKLYVINHALNHGGERVDSFKILENSNKTSLKYIKSFIFPFELSESLNNLVVIKDDEFFITTWLPTGYTDKNGTFSTTPYSQICIAGLFAFNRKTIHSYHCRGTKANSEMANCTIIPNSASLSSNGIAFDFERKVLYIAHTIERKIKAYNVTDGEAQFSHEIDIGYGIDNIDFYPETGHLYLAVIGRQLDTINKMNQIKTGKPVNLNNTSEMLTGALRVDTRNNDKIDLLLLQNKLIGTSVARIQNHKIILGSFIDNGLLLCEIPKNYFK